MLAVFILEIRITFMTSLTRLQWMLLVKPFYLKHQAKKVGDSSSTALIEHHDEEEEGEGTNVVGGGHGGGHGHGDHVRIIPLVVLGCDVIAI